MIQQLGASPAQAIDSAASAEEEFFAFPVSFAQQRLWFLNQLEPESPAYNTAMTVRMSGRLDSAALHRSLIAIVERHEILRTSFRIVDGQPLQLIAPSLDLPVPLVDLRHLPAATAEAEAGRLAAAEALQPFDLQRAPLLRASLLRLDETTHILLLTLHHIITDGWSMGVLVQELSVFYTAFTQGTLPDLPELPIQYADYAIWQRDWLSPQGGHAVLDRHLAYWRQQLASAPAVLELPTDRPRPPVQTFRGADLQITIAAPLCESLVRLSKRAGATLFMTLLAAFQTLLYRYTAQTDIVVGSPIANRRRTELECLIGLFVNTLALRTDLSGNPRFTELLQRVRDMTLEAYAHQDVPFEQLVEALAPERNLSHSPIFQVLFVLQNAPASTIALPGLTLTPLPDQGGVAKFDLTLMLEETDAGLQGWFEYNTDLFDATTIARLADHFVMLLQAIVDDSNTRLSDLTLLTAAEREQMLAQWNATQSAYNDQACFHQLFEFQATRTPDSVAVIFNTGSRQQGALTYRELNERANQLAHHLRARGVGPESRVGICVERSLELLVGLLGILKAGGAYVPLDPSYPEDRLAFMLADAQAQVVVTQRHLPIAGFFADTQLIDLDDAGPIDREPIANPAHATLPEQVAYILYTSGSTGKPKGVQIPHRALVNFLESMRRRPGLTADDVLVAVTTVSFDIAALELFLPLLVGARVVIASRELAVDGEQLAATLAAVQATVMQATPATWRMLLEAGWSSVTPIRMLCGGEALPLLLARQLAGIGEVWNLYGPTETTIWSSACRFEPDAPVVTIGSPIANTQLYILDQHLQPVPIGVAGELHIGGNGLARGYRNRPELTAERFIPDPFSQSCGARLYKTGDLVRYRVDGSIEYLERIDHQVKVRGYRIELGEIEAALLRHPAVGEAVVVVQHDANGDKRLVAYLVAEQKQALGATGTSGTDLKGIGTSHGYPAQKEEQAQSASPLVLNSPQELRRFLATQLPEYMLPTAFVTLPALPLTLNGKVNRRALPDPDWFLDTAAGTFETARTLTEEILAGIWSDVLRLERINIHDNFFSLGGHSLLATQIIARVRDALQVELPLRTLFQQPTVAKMAACIEERSNDRPATDGPIPPLPRPDPIPLSFNQHQLWSFQREHPDNPVHNVLLALRISGQLNRAALQQSFDALALRHEVLRTSFTTSAGQAVQVIAPDLSVPLALVDLRQLPQAARDPEIQRRATVQAQQPFDLEQAPLLRITLLELDDAEHVLLLTLHHILIDGWSLGVLVRELTTLYAAYADSAEPELPELPIQYADYALWQRRWLQGKQLDRQMTYWRQQLADAPATLELPTDRPRPPLQSFHGARHLFLLPLPLSTALNELSRREGTTLFMTLLAAFHVLLARYSGQEDMVVGTRIANRTRVETEGLIGFFANTLVLRANLAGTRSFRQVLQQVREVMLGAYTHQDLPFEYLVEQLQPEQDTTRHPLYQVQCILQTAPIPALELPGLRLELIPVDPQMTPLDLALELTDTDQGLRGFFEYNVDLFDPATIVNMRSDYEMLLAEIADNPDQALVDLLNRR
jgi:amino acid adenylation domain-containing protein